MVVVVLTQQGLPIRQLADLHTPVGPAREQPSMRVDVELSHSLPYVLEEAAPGVLGRERQQDVGESNGPDLQRTNFFIAI